MAASKPREKTWRISFSVAAELGKATTAWADEFYPTHSAFEQPNKSLRFDLLSTGVRPDEAQIGVALAIIGKPSDGSAPVVSVEEVPDADWRAVTYAAFPPVTIGRVVIHGSHHADAIPAGAIGLQIDAATAFGTGEHPTTAGCLLALQDLAKRQGFRPNRLLDVGTGTGVLAMAMVRLWGRPVLATDIDAEAVRVARENARENRLSKQVRALETGRLDQRDIRTSGPYDLIVANILAKPLIGLSRDLSRLVAPGGRVVLSGLLSHQAKAVQAFYRLQGLSLISDRKIEDWSALTLRRG
ncbi:MAG: 50S ribosomal protein L11 methyltransferase [Pseudomonadota bacterium]